MKLRFPATLLILAALMAGSLLPACCSNPYKTPDERLAAEFNWDKYSETTPVFEIPVAFPSWLQPADKEKVLEAVDDYAQQMCENYPWAVENFDFSAYTVWIHDNPGAFVAGSSSSPCWALGWQVGKFCVVAWGLASDDNGIPSGLAIHNILPALIHEWFHAVFQERYGWADSGHFMYYPQAEVQHCMRAASAWFMSMRESIVLSDVSIWGALHVKYHPWIFPSEAY